MKRIVTHAFPSPLLSLTEQFLVGAGKQSKQNPTESRECSVLLSPIRFFALQKTHLARPYHLPSIPKKNLHENCLLFATL